VQDLAYINGQLATTDELTKPIRVVITAKSIVDSNNVYAVFTYGNQTETRFVTNSSTEWATTVFEFDGNGILSINIPQEFAEAGIGGLLVQRIEVFEAIIINDTPPTSDGSDEMTVKEGEMNAIILTADNIVNFEGVIFTFIYDDDMLGVLNIIRQSYIDLISVSDGEIIFSVNMPVPDGMAWSGSLIIIEFTAKNSGIAMFEFMAE
jgi:hypothetical protein